MARDFKSYLEKGAPWVEAAVPELLKDLQWNPEITDLVRNYLSGGKKVRPLLALWTYAQLSGNDQKPSLPILKCAMALEFIHAYSLIHDDLPCMDNDDFRRGVPTLHRLIGDGPALLVGDALLTGAFELLGQSTLPASSTVELVRTLSRAAGAVGMIDGQWRDVLATKRGVNTHLSKQELLTIHEKKTGALLGASLSFGAILSRTYGSAVSWQDSKNLYDCGVKLGVLFQVVDDLLEDTQRVSTEVNSTHAFSRPELESLKTTLAQETRSIGLKFFDAANWDALLVYWTRRQS